MWHQKECSRSMGRQEWCLCDVAWLVHCKCCSMLARISTNMSFALLLKILNGLTKNWLWRCSSRLLWTGQRGASIAKHLKTLFFDHFSRNSPNHSISSIPPWTLPRYAAILNVRGALDNHRRCGKAARKQKWAKWDISHLLAESLEIRWHMSQSQRNVGGLSTKGNQQLVYGQSGALK